MEVAELTKPPHHRRIVVSTTTTQPPLPPPEQQPPPPTTTVDGLLVLSAPTGWVLQLVASQVELVASTVASISSLFFSLLAQSKASTEEAPSRVAHRGAALLKRLGSGVLAAAYVWLVLFAVLAVAVVFGVGVVRVWVEEPVSLHQPLYFDYTEENPSAVVGLWAGGKGRMIRAVPVGHTFHVSMAMVLPESDFNREIGIFQVIAEVIASNGEVISRSSQPCMLRFRSLPVRLIRTLTMTVPLLAGITCETQKLIVGLLKYKEGSNPRTDAIRIRLSPRAGTLDLPQLYEAELHITSQLPWRKEMVHNWKWTLYVWVSLYLYVTLLALLLCFFRPPFGLHPRARPSSTGAVVEGEEEMSGTVVEEEQVQELTDEFTEALRKWRARARRRRKVVTTPSCYTRLVAEAVGPEEGIVSSVGGGEQMGDVIDDSDAGELASESSEAVGG